MQQRRFGFLLVFIGLITVAGLWLPGYFFRDFGFFFSRILENPIWGGFIAICEELLAVAPWAPLIAGLLVLLNVAGPRSEYFRWFAVLYLPLGIPAALAFSVIGAPFLFVSAMTLLVGQLASFRAVFQQSGNGNRNRLFILAGVLPAFLMALWSLSFFGAAIWSATRIAEGNPYCIANHAERRPIRNIFELRGISFETGPFGYKDSSNWAYHGVLIVEKDPALEYYNWSRSSRTFEPLSSGREMRLHHRIAGSCVPIENFLREVALGRLPSQ